MSKLKNTLTTKRFVIRKSLIGKNTVITFVNKKQENVSYFHDEVYNFSYLVLRNSSVLTTIGTSSNTSNIVNIVFIISYLLLC